jgi:hypothetical protein
MVVSKTFAGLCFIVALVLSQSFAQGRELGDVEGRWVFIASSSNGAEEFVDGSSIVFEKQFNAWACWVRILDPQRHEESIERHLYRNGGQEFAIVTYVTYDTKSHNPKNSRDEHGSPKWRNVIPDSFAENVWAAIQLKNGK